MLDSFHAFSSDEEDDGDFSPLYAGIDNPVAPAAAVFPVSAKMIPRLDAAAAMEIQAKLGLHDSFYQGLNVVAPMVVATPQSDDSKKVMELEQQLEAERARNASIAKKANDEHKRVKADNRTLKKQVAVSDNATVASQKAATLTKNKLAVNASKRATKGKRNPKDLDASVKKKPRKQQNSPQKRAESESEVLSPSTTTTRPTQNRLVRTYFIDAALL